MPRSSRTGFTLIELLIVVVIIGILAATAIPKFSTTKDKARLASVRSDVRNAMMTMVQLSSDSGRFVAGAPADFTLSPGNTFAVDPTPDAIGSGYTLSVLHSAISVGPKQCTVTVGSGAGSDNGVIICAP